LLLRHLHQQLVRETALGDNEELLCLALLGVAHHAAGAEDGVGEGDNVVAAGRCIDADLPALSSVRVMGPCMAMGAAAAKALDLAGTGSVHQIDIAALAKRVHDNVETKHMRWPDKAA